MPDSEHIFVADLAEHVGDLRAGEEVAVFCRTGHRAAMAASILERAGMDVRLVSKGGAGDWPGPLEPLETVAYHMASQRFEVDHDVGKFRHSAIKN